MRDYAIARECGPVKVSRVPNPRIDSITGSNHVSVKMRRLTIGLCDTSSQGILKLPAVEGLEVNCNCFQKASRISPGPRLCTCLPSARAVLPSPARRFCDHKLCWSLSSPARRGSYRLDPRVRKNYRVRLSVTPQEGCF